MISSQKKLWFSMQKGSDPNMFTVQIDLSKGNAIGFAGLWKETASDDIVIHLGDGNILYKTDLLSQTGAAGNGSGHVYAATSGFVNVTIQASQAYFQINYYANYNVSPAINAQCGAIKISGTVPYRSNLANGFMSFCQGLTNLTDVSGLDLSENPGNYNFSSFFQNCSSLTTVTPGLLQHQTSPGGSVLCSYMFDNSGIMSLPDGVIDYIPSIYWANGICRNTAQLTSVGTNTLTKIRAASNSADAFTGSAFPG